MTAVRWRPASTYQTCLGECHVTSTSLGQRFLNLRGVLISAALHHEGPEEEQGDMAAMARTATTPLSSVSPSSKRSSQPIHPTRTATRGGATGPPCVPEVVHKAIWALHGVHRLDQPAAIAELEPTRSEGADACQDLGQGEAGRVYRGPGGTLS